MSTPTDALNISGFIIFGTRPWVTPAMVSGTSLPVTVSTSTLFPISSVMLTSLVRSMESPACLFSFTPSILFDAPVTGVTLRWAETEKSAARQSNGNITRDSLIPHPPPAGSRRFRRQGRMCGRKPLSAPSPHWSSPSRPQQQNQPSGACNRHCGLCIGT